MVVAHKSSSDEIGILRKLFEKYASPDGSIWFEDFREAMSGHSDEDLRFMFDAMVSQVAVGGSVRIEFDGMNIDSLESFLFLGLGWWWQNTIHGVHCRHH